jgi:hypothetical protein
VRIDSGGQVKKPNGAGFAGLRIEDVHEPVVYGRRFARPGPMRRMLLPRWVEEAPGGTRAVARPRIEEVERSSRMH